MAKLMDKFIEFSVLKTILYFIFFGIAGLVILGIAALLTWLFGGDFNIYKLSFNIIAYIFLGIIAILVLLLAIKFIFLLVGAGVGIVSKIHNISAKHKEKKMLKRKEKEHKKLENMKEEELYDFLFNNSEYSIHIFTGDKPTAEQIIDLLKVDNDKFSWGKIDPIDENFNGNEVEWWGTGDIEELDDSTNDDTPHIDLRTKKGAPGNILGTLSRCFPNLVLGFVWNNVLSGNGYATVMKNGEVLNQEEFDLSNYLDDEKDYTDEEIENNYIKLLNDEGKSIYDFTAKYIEEHPEELEILKQKQDEEVNE